MRFKAMKDLKVSKEIRNKLKEMNFTKFFTIFKPKTFLKKVFFTFIDYFYLYDFSRFENILRLLAQKHKEIDSYIENIIRFMQSTDNEKVKSGYSKSKKYREDCLTISEILFKKTGIQLKENENCLFAANAKFLLLLPSAFTVFDVNETRVTTRTIGNQAYGNIYFLKSEKKYYALYLSNYPTSPIVFNKQVNPRIILSCGEPVTNVKPKDNKCNCSKKHLLYTQEKCLVKMKTPFKQEKNVCVKCQKEKQNMLTCEQCKYKNCIDCNKNSKNYLCGMCGFSNFSRRLATNENFMPQGNQYMNYSNLVINPNNEFIQNDPSMQGYVNNSQYNPLVSNHFQPNLNYPIENYEAPVAEIIPTVCQKCYNYNKCKNCNNLVYENPTGLCESCLQKICKACNREVINIQYCRICQNCSKCQNPLQAFFGCIDCGGKKEIIKKGMLLMESEDNYSEVDPSQRSRCLNCDKSINISHKDTLCCKCSNQEFSKVCLECKKMHYEHYYGAPNTIKFQDFSGRIKGMENRSLFQDQASSLNKNEDYCKECKVCVKGFLGLCLCRKILFASMDTVEKELELLMKSD
ncbi:hypothetical protein SteCoe_5288 [Stentor coeruleus]|uniref:Uncharacterized protein n=1 Tax=Stentor coeruleus TaxID=5963 RepID=A0A1R2CSV6_9CILI|nr:hypothetical protein SteCoe_5288 [Stentor coeruleus]